MFSKGRQNEILKKSEGARAREREGWERWREREGER